MIFISISQLFYLDLDVVNLVQPGMSFFWVNMVGIEGRRARELKIFGRG